MAANAYKAYVPFDSGSVDQDDPTGVDAASVLAENALFFAESAGQVRIKIVDADLASAQSQILSATWYEVYESQIDVTLRPQGGAFRFRVRLAGRVSAAATGTFRLAIGIPALIHEQLTATTLGDNCAEFTTSSTTAAWLSQDLLIVDPAEVASAVHMQETVLTAGGVVTAAPVTRLVVRVISKTTASATTGNLNGLIVEEYVGT